LSNREAPEIWTTSALRLAVEAAGVALWSWNITTDELSLDEAARKLWGVSPSDTEVSFEDLSAHIHPADRDRVRHAFYATRAVSGRYEIDFRILFGNVVRWISARGQGADAEVVGDVTFGVFIDVTERKQAEESNELLAGEMSHRVKNLLSIASGLTSMTSRSTTTTVDMARELTQRLSALGRAHDLVRPLPGHDGRAALLGDLIAILLEPYDEKGAFKGRIRVAVPRIGVGEQSATTIALVIHELATNSLKYGSLSADAGLLDISGVTNDSATLTIRWIERGGPDVTAPPARERTGFGSKLVERTLSQQLGGSIHYEWLREGVVVTLEIDKDRLST
jgi:two-component sensor histidine kinase